jgi:hypothetical protein
MTMKNNNANATLIGKAIASFVHAADKLATMKETITKTIATFLKDGGTEKEIRKAVIAAGVDRRRVSDILKKEFGLVSEHAEARSKAARANKAPAPSAAKLEKAGAVVNFVKAQGRNLDERVEILNLAIAELKKAAKKASK